MEHSENTRVVIAASFSLSSKVSLTCTTAVGSEVRNYGDKLPISYISRNLYTGRTYLLLQTKCSVLMEAKLRKGHNNGLRKHLRVGRTKRLSSLRDVIWCAACHRRCVLVSRIGIHVHVIARPVPSRHGTYFLASIDRILSGHACLSATTTRCFVYFYLGDKAIMMYKAG